VDTGAWAGANGANITNGKALAQSATDGYALFLVREPSSPPFPDFSLNECWISIDFDIGGIGDGTAFMSWSVDSSRTLELTVDKNGTIKRSSGVVFAEKFRNTLRMREHNGCVHVETSAPSDATWTEVTAVPSPAWLATSPTSIRFGIRNPTVEPANVVAFDNYNLPPLP
jgi:hypothetical protein